MSDELHAFVIEGSGFGRITRITLDGVELRGVTRAVLEIDPGDPREPTRLMLEVIPGTIKATGTGSLEVRGHDG